MIDDNRILIVGAGSVGLSLACLLAAAHTPFRLIDAKDGIGEESRALGIHARTLEVMQSLSLAEAFVKAGRVTRYMTFHERNKSLFSFDFKVLSDDTRFPFYLIVPQCDTETILYKKLQELGGEVEWRTPLHSIEDGHDGVKVHFEKETLGYPFVVGCDGAASLVRKALGIDFSGTTYDARFLLSEVWIADDQLPTDATHVIMARDSVLAAIPLPNGSYRLVGSDSLAPKNAKSGAAITFDAFTEFLDRNGLFPNAKFHNPSRVVSYQMQKRVADKFMGKRTFLAGDAANLAWKLSIAFRRPSTSLLESYADERRGVAQTVAAGTDKALRLLAAPSFLLRSTLRLVAPIILRFWQPHKLMHAMAQLAVGYRTSEQSLTGTRLPYVKLADGRDLFDLLRPGRPLLLHIRTEPSARLREVSEIFLVDNHYFRADPSRERCVQQHPASFSELNKLFGATRILVRPDGYIAAIDRSMDAINVATTLDKWGLSPHG